MLNKTIREVILMKQVHVAKSIKEYSNEILDFQKGFPLNTVYIDGRNKKNLFLYRGQKKITVVLNIWLVYFVNKKMNIC